MELQSAQWKKIIDMKLGLRSCSFDEVIGVSEMKPAAYGMDMPLSYRDVVIPDRDIVPSDWKQTLILTIRHILGFGDANNRYLCIVTGVKGLNYEYGGCFATCKTKPTTIIAEKSLFFAKENDVVNWVIENIPN